MDPAELTIELEDLHRVTRALRKGDALRFFDDYLEEVASESNSGEYIKYLEQLEARGEVPSGKILLHPVPNTCIRTFSVDRNGRRRKMFLNLCTSSDLLSNARSSRAATYILGPPRLDKDRKGEFCITRECVVSVRTLELCRIRPELYTSLYEALSDMVMKSDEQNGENISKDFVVMKKIISKGKVRPLLVKDDNNACEIENNDGTIGHQEIPESPDSYEETENLKSITHPSQCGRKNELVYRNNITISVNVEQFEIEPGSIDLPQTTKYEIVEIHEDKDVLSSHTITKTCTLVGLKVVVKVPPTCSGSDLSVDIRPNGDYMRVTCGFPNVNICIQLPSQVDIPTCRPCCGSLRDFVGSRLNTQKNEITCILPVKARFHDTTGHPVSQTDFREIREETFNDYSDSDVSSQKSDMTFPHVSCSIELPGNSKVRHEEKTGCAFKRTDCVPQSVFCESPSVHIAESDTEKEDERNSHISHNPVKHGDMHTCENKYEDSTESHTNQTRNYRRSILMSCHALPLRSTLHLRMF